MVTTCTKQLPFEARSYWSHACCDCFWKLGAQSQSPSLTSERKHDGHGQHALLWVLKIMLLVVYIFETIQLKAAWLIRRHAVCAAETSTLTYWWANRDLKAAIWYIPLFAASSWTSLFEDLSKEESFWLDKAETSWHRTGALSVHPQTVYS